jgi:hypothetical protein
MAKDEAVAVDRNQELSAGTQNIFARAHDLEYRQSNRIDNRLPGVLCLVEGSSTD